MSDAPRGFLRPPASPLAPLLAKAEEALHERTQMVLGVLEGRAFSDITVPRTVPAVVARMRLLTRAETKQVRQECRLALQEIGLAEAARAPAPESYEEWHTEIVTRTIAVAVRRMDADAPLAPLDEWLLCDDDQIDSLWVRYQDLQSKLDPLARPLTDIELQIMGDAAKKKDAISLLSYGSSALASYAITMAAHQGN